MNNKSLMTYALIESMAEQGGDYLDCFWPFAIKGLEEKKTQNITTVQRFLQSNYALSVPFQVVRTILKRARRGGYAESKGDRYQITEKGTKFLEESENERDVERRIRELIVDLKEYFCSKAVAVNEQQAYDLLVTFIQENINPLLEFLNPKEFDIDSTYIKPNTHNERILIRYISEIESSKPTLFQTFKDLIFGSIFTVLLSVPDSTRITEMMERPLKKCEIYLDTNFIFSVMGMHSTERNQQARELLNLLDKCDCHLYVFDFTVGEICRVVKEFVFKGQIYPTSVHVDSVYSSLNIYGWTKARAITFITNVESELKAKGLVVTCPPKSGPVSMLD